MPQVVEDVASLLEQLNHRITALESRVSALEHSTSASIGPSASDGNVQVDPSPDVALRAEFGRTGNVVTDIGKAVLGIAGAYLLRAIAESISGAQFPMLIAAIVYASAWMAWAVRVHRKDHFASAIYGITATLVLTPLLYESTVRFQLLSITSTSSILVAFVVLVLLLARRSNLQVLPWVGIIASIATAWALIFSTHELVPLTIALLGIALATEVATCLGQWLSPWAVVAVATDSAVLLFIYLMTSPNGVPSSYTPASPTVTVLLPLGILCIYGGGIAIRSFGQVKKVSSFEVLQGILAFALSYLGATRASNGSAPLIGIVFLALALLCYWGVLSRSGGDKNVRNQRIAAMWAVMLMVVGMVMVFSPTVATLISCILAIAAVFLHRRHGSLTLAVHTSLYLALAAVVSPSLSYFREAFAGTMPGAPHWTVWTVLVSALLCYSLLRATPEAGLSRRLFWVPPALLVSAAVAALVIVVLHSLIAMRFELGASHIAGIRTAVTCLVALTLAFIASRLNRPELGWLAYTTVGLGALKLLVEDLRLGNAALVVSLLFYGLILISLPRLLRASDSQSVPAKLRTPSQ
jgi:hypothetical protein